MPSCGTMPTATKPNKGTLNMIVSQSLKKEQMYQRLNLKTAEESLKSIIVTGTNCSRFESKIIVEKAKESFGLGQYEEGRVLLDGQMIFHAISADIPPGVAISESMKKRVILTVLDREEDLEVMKKHSRSDMRRQQLLRIAVEAKEQDALLTQEDIALVLSCDVRTIRSDIQKLRKNKNIIVPTRGIIRDIGPSLSHKQEAISLWLQGKEALEVAQHLNHSLKAIERYIQTFCRVVYSQRSLRNILKTAMIVGVSLSLAKAYWELHCDLIEFDEFYKERLDDVLECGETHWIAQDGKKNPLLTKKCQGVTP